MQRLVQLVRAVINRLGYDICRISQKQENPPPEQYDAQKLYINYSRILKESGIVKAHYGSGENLMGEGWVNIDRMAAGEDPDKLYMSANLASRHPFPSNHFQFAFAEDFIEHLTQDGSLNFLSEVFRCLKPGGVLRLSFPGLGGVLRWHYLSSDYDGAAVGQHDAYTYWEHKHFYCEESLSIVARHIGFSDIKFVKYGISNHAALNGLDHREDQKDLNIYVELTK